VFFIATSRTELVVIAVLLIVGGARISGIKGALGGLMAFAILAAVVWNASPYLRDRIAHGEWEIQEYSEKGSPTSIGLRLDWWRKSVELIAKAPLLGYGTGSIRSLYAAHGPENAEFSTTNPHNQIITVTLQLGLVGMATLFAMWFFHLMLFRGTGLLAWLGLVVVLQNMVGSLFNSHLFDFAEGWTYVWGVGVIGGTVLRAWSAEQRLIPASSERPPESLQPAQAASER
jgi:hypothetical protein